MESHVMGYIRGCHRDHFYFLFMFLTEEPTPGLQSFEGAHL